MKLYHFIIIFAIIAFTITVVLDIQTEDCKAVIKNKELLDQKLDRAVDDGVARLVQVDDNNNLVINKNAAIESFFVSLNASFDILSDQEAIQKLNLYIPVITITMEDGYYIFYSDTYRAADGKTYYRKRWSEKFPYYYEDDDFIYGFTLSDKVKLYDKNNILDPTGNQTVFEMDYHDLQNKDEFEGFRKNSPDSLLLSEEAFCNIKRTTFIECVENAMAYYTSRHNHIASHYGITYNFSLPSIDEDKWNGFLEKNSMFVVFQGYPYNGSMGETYNRVATAGAKVSKNILYYLEQKGWYLIYHKSSCPELNNGGIIFHDEPYYRVEDCARAGAYACKICSGDTSGVFAPDYTVK